jgi:hypothetical protein
MDKPIPIKERFRIKGIEINEPEQDLLFEICRVHGFWAYRIRPFNLKTGSGGWGDHILEITSSNTLPNAPGTEIEISLFRDSI